MRLHHLAFRTGDLARLERFYVEALGLSVVRRSERGVWLEAGEAVLMLEGRGTGEPAPDPTSMDLVAFAIAREEHAIYMDRLARANITVEGRTAYSIYFRDPDGRRIGLSAYPAELASLA